MKEIKYILSAVIMLVIMVFISEMYVWNMDSFETEYISTTMYPAVNVTQNEMLQEIEDTAKKNHCLLFTVTRNIKSIYSEDVIIYGMDGAAEILSSKSSIESGRYQSAILGKIKIKIKEFSEIPDVNEITEYYLIGDMQDARNFKKVLVDKYSGNFPKEGYTYMNAKRNILGVWGISILFFVLMTMFEVVLIKKELIVRFIYGDSLYRIVAKKIVSNLVVYIGEYAVIFGILKWIFHLKVDYYLKYSVLSMAVCCILNTLIYMGLLKSNYQAVLCRGKYSKSILNISYVFKGVSMAILTIVISICAGMIMKGADYWKQEKFFEEYKEYSYISLAAKDDKIESTEELSLSILKDKTSKNQALLNVYLDEGMFSKRPCLLFNTTGFEYLSRQIPELRNKKYDKKVYFVLPESQKEVGKTDLDFLLSMYMGENVEREVITYSSSANVIGMKNEGKIESSFYSNPLIILNLSDNLKYFNGIYISQSCMYRIGQEEWGEYLDRNDVCRNISYITNSWDNYQYQLKQNQRMILLAGAVLGLLVLMEIILIRTIMYYECTLNIMELTIKTTLGYSKFEKYKRLFIVTFFGAVGGMAFSLIMAVGFAEISVFNLVAAYSIIICIEVICIIYFIRRMEKLSLVKMMKGALL